MEGAIREFFQLFPDGAVQLCQGEESLITESCGYLGRNDANRSLRIRLILRSPYAGRNDRRVVMLRHLMVDGVEFLIIPIIIVYHGSFGVIRNQDTGYAAELLIHMYMSGDPCTLLLIDKGFNVRILPVRHNANKEKGRDGLAGIWIRDLSRISGPINLDLFTGLPIDVHGGAAFLLILLDVIAELGIHKRLITGLTAFLKVFRTKEILIDSISEQFLLDVGKVRHPFC